MISWLLREIPDGGCCRLTLVVGGVLGLGGLSVGRDDIWELEDDECEVRIPNLFGVT